MNNQYTCAIVDDEPLARKLLTNYVEKTPQLKLEGTFKSAQEVITFLETNTVDLLFSDIRMPGLSGIGLMESSTNLPSVIFTTAYEEYAVKAFELEVIDYLVKPIPIERFQKAVSRFQEFAELKQTPQQDSNHLLLKANHGIVRIEYDDILYIEAKGEYMKFVLTNKLPELIYIRMKELEEKLGEGFIRIHKSHLVNVHKINKVVGSDLLVGEEKLKVSRRYRPEVMRRLNG